MEVVTISYAARNSLAEASAIFFIHSRSAWLLSSTHFATGGMTRPIRVGTSGSSTRMTRALLFKGQVRAATSRTVAPAAGEPSAAMTNRTGEGLTSTRPRTTRTLVRASASTFWETLPKTKRPRAERPCEPTTIRPGFHSSALVISWLAGEPKELSAVTCHFGKIERRRFDACAHTALLL